MGTGDIVSIVICVVCLVMSAYFSGTETAYLSFNRVRMKLLATTDRRAKLVMKLEEKYDKVISTILVGNNIVNILCSSLATVLFLKIDEVNGATLSTVLITVLVLIFGEISPKTVSKQMADSFILFSAPILNGIMFILTPITIIFRGLQTLLAKIFRAKEEVMSEEELKTIVSEATEDGAITRQEGELIRSAIEFHVVTVQDILTPRVDVAAAEENDLKEEIAEMFHNTGFSRIPVYRDTIDNIIGVIHEKNFFAAPEEQPLSEIISPATCVPPHMKVQDLLRKLQREKVHLAIVVDEFGGTEGIVTLEDVLEELVGEIWDEHDTVVEAFRQTGEHTYLVAGDTDLTDLTEKFNLILDCDAVTVGGWVIREIGHLPEPEEFFCKDNLTVTVKKVEERRITEIEITEEEPAEPEEDQ